MAVINFRMLTLNEGWSKVWKKLTPSARNLLVAGLAPFTDKDGKGSPKWATLMAASGIKGKDTFQRAKQQLVDFDFVSYEKVWFFEKKNNRKLPRARINYQITKDILWKKDGNTASSEPKPQSMVFRNSPPRESRRNSLDVKKDVNNTAKAVEDKNSSKRFYPGTESVGKILGRLEVLPQTKPPSYKKWQDHALRLAKRVGVKPTASWFKVFKNAHLKGKAGLLEAAVSYIADAENVESKEKLFYWKFWQLLKGKNP